MRKLIVASILVLSFGIPSIAHAKTFKNCTELHKVYPRGVAKSAKAAGHTGATVNAKVYAENSKSDRDKDGVACEK